MKPGDVVKVGKVDHIPYQKFEGLKGVVVDVVPRGCADGTDFVRVEFKTTFTAGFKQGELVPNGSTNTK